MNNRDQEILAHIRTRIHGEIYSTRNKIAEHERAADAARAHEKFLLSQARVLDTCLDATNIYRKGGPIL